jgi:hypothetical protein
MNRQHMGITVSFSATTEQRRKLPTKPNASYGFKQLGRRHFPNDSNRVFVHVQVFQQL